MANLARHMKIDPEQSLRDANYKFSLRFNLIEDKLNAKGSAPERSNLAEMDALWDEVKREENILVKKTRVVA
jgi:ATP diphosphatase